jgi:2-dehydropantoate 2-reductase
MPTCAGRDVTFWCAAPRRITRPRGTKIAVRTVTSRCSCGRRLAAPSAGGRFDLILVGVKSYSLDEEALDWSHRRLTEHHDSADTQRYTSRPANHQIRRRACVGRLGESAPAWTRRVVPSNSFPTTISCSVKSQAVPATGHACWEACFEGASFNGRSSTAIIHDMWEKFVQISLFAGSPVRCASVGDILAAPGGREARFEF